ncbi:sulfotransferase [Catellatospora aurea]|uniref:Sulfotransferase n=1 Tax=Catellatospora aurea TaxID=1337874 RepID=A0ABW2GUE0_9ACTN
MSATQPGLLVTGLPRSGTSWVGKMVEAGRQVVYVNEPLNVRHPPGRSPGVLDADVTHRFQYICADNEDVWLRAFRRTLALRYGVGRELRRNHAPYDIARMVKYATAFATGRLRGRRAMLDDPYALMAVPWLAEKFGVRSVVLVRDPVSLVGSYRKLGWHISLDELLGQPLLTRDLLADHVDELREAAAKEDEIHTTALLWRVVYDVVDRVHRHVPGVLVRRYEDFAMRPEEEFGALYAHFGLNFDEQARAQVVAATTAGEQDSQRGFVRSGTSKTAFRPMDSKQALAAAQNRLSAEDAARVVAITRDVLDRFRPAGTAA